MVFLFQTLGTLIAVVAVSALLRSGTRPDGTAGIFAMAVAAAGLIAGGSVYGALDEANAQRKADPLPRAAALAAPGVNAAFLAWASARMPRDATFATVPGLDPALIDYQWVTYQLLPRRLVPLERADYVLFYAVAPADAEFDDRAAFKRPVLLSPTFGLAERRDAG